MGKKTTVDERQLTTPSNLDLATRLSDETRTSIDEAERELTDVSTSSFECEICGRSFSNEKSLKMHMLRMHPEVVRGGPPTDHTRPSVPSLEAEVPDPFELLKTHVQIYGCSKRDAEAVATYLAPYGVDNLIKLNEALRNVNMPLPKRAMCIEAWSNARGIALPKKLALELGISPTSRPMTSFAGLDPYDDVQMSGVNPTAMMIAFMNNQTKTLETVVQTVVQLLSNNRNRESEDPSWKEEVRELREQLEEERRKREEAERAREEAERKQLENKLAQLEQKLTELEKRPMDAELKKLDILDKRLSDISRVFELVVKASVEPPSHPKPRETKSAELTVEELQALNIPFEVESEEGGE
jgi:flagellar biosynthesis/type III secretory pathway chaperone